MANVFLNLPTFAADGPGTAVDVSSMGAIKTVTVAKTGAVFQPFVTIEFSNEAAPTSWTTLKTFYGAGQQTFVVAALWMRATVGNYRGGAAPNCDVGSDDAGTSGVNLPVTASSGTGAAVDVSALPVFKTIQVGGVFRGATNVEISEDGIEYETIASFSAGKQYSATFAAQWMRVVRDGVPDVSPGLPIVNVGASSDGGGGGGGGGNAQRFAYEVVGDEPDLANLVIALPSARANALYQVWVQQGDVTSQLQTNVELASRTTAQFVLSLGADATAGDVFWFYVDDPT
jgi:hypothetical protein